MHSRCRRCAMEARILPSTARPLRQLNQIHAASFELKHCTRAASHAGKRRTRGNTSPPPPCCSTGLRTLCFEEDHRIPAWQGLEGTSVDHPVQPTCQSSITQSRLHRTLSRQGLNISREGDSTASLGSLFQGSVTLRGKKFFLMFRRNFPRFSLCPLPLVLSLGTTKKSLAPSS